ncbi:hypothetical protein [Caballeronia sp. KNU42]
MADPSTAGMRMDDLPSPQSGRYACSTAALIRSTQLLRTTRSSHSGCQAGVKDGYDIALPTTAKGVYIVSRFPADPEAERTLHIDRYSGRIHSGSTYRDYGRVAKWITYGISLHKGRYFGVANQILASLISLGPAAPCQPISNRTSTA